MTRVACSPPSNIEILLLSLLIGQIAGDTGGVTVGRRLTGSTCTSGKSPGVRMTVGGVYEALYNERKQRLKVECTYALALVVARAEKILPVIYSLWPRWS